MAIRWDSVLVRALATDLRVRLDQARARAVHLDHGRRILTVYFRSATLTFRLHPSRGDVALDPPREPGDGARPLPAILMGIDVRFDDRILTLRFRRVRGRTRRVDVVVELMSNQWNALVMEGDPGVVRHALWSRKAGGRILRAGTRYTPPAASDRVGPDVMSAESWNRIFAPDPPEQGRAALLGMAAYTSPINAPSLLALEPAAARARWAELVAEPLTEPSVLSTERGLQPYPHRLEGVPSRPAEDLLQAFAAAEAHLNQETEAAPGHRLGSDLSARLLKASKRARGKVVQLERQMANTSRAETLRASGDLLLARLHEVPQGAESVVLMGFEGAEVEIALDPSVEPAENARSYYDRAGRAERAAARVPAMLASARSDLERLESLAARLEAGEATEEEVRQVLPAGRERDQAGPAAPSVPYKVYRSSGGLEIRVGRGSRHNDALTFHHSSPDDIWLHARHAAGAHVILRWNGEGNPPSRDLGEAAVLAALHSRARTSGSVPVDWTRRKHVRKPRKAPPGLVTPDRVKTVFVEPDPDVEARLSADAASP